MTILETCLFVQFPEVTRVLETYGIHSSGLKFFWIIPGYLFSYLLYFPLGKILDRFWIGFLLPEGTREGENLKKRVKRMRTYLMASIYYSSSFLFVLIAAVYEGLLPILYGGDLDLAMEQKRWPRQTGVLVTIVYLFQYGHHLERLLNHAVNEYHSATFWTMSLHHILTVGMIAVSFQTRITHFGIAVLMMLDFSDCLLQLSRFLRETTFQGTAKVTFVFLVISWLHGRVLGLGWEVIPAVVKMALSRHLFVHQFFSIHVFYVIGLCVFWLLNVFWFYQIVKIFVSVFIKKIFKFDYEDSALKKKEA